MVEIATAGGAVLFSLVLCLFAMRMLKGRPIETRGMAGLGLTAVHMALSLVLPAICWVAFRPERPLLYTFGVLVFYLISLIILVAAIIRWLRAGSPQRDRSPDDPVT